jgi:hypothetical protein
MPPRVLVLLSFVFCVSPPSAAQPVITEDAKLVGSGTDSFANAGWSIAAAEGFIVLGAFGDESDPTTGAAYVFRETGDGWGEEVRLNAPQQSFFTFGMAVGAWSDGIEDVVIVGARGNGFQPETDAAYIFRETDGVWVEEARLSNGPDIHEAFGSSVAVHGDYAVVGAFGADDVGESSGAAYVYRTTADGTWIEDARLVASDASTPAGFGRKVAIVVSRDGVPFALAGAPSDSDQRGAVYGFRRTPEGTWVEEAKLVAPDSDTGDLFGRAVALAETPSGEILALAGALGDRDAGLQSGAGYVFRRGGDGSWAFEEKLTAAEGMSGQRLGWSVALAATPEVGGTVAVLGGDGAYNFAGTVRLFRRTAGESGPVWTEEAELWASDRAPGDQIGYSVGVSGRYAVAGAPSDDGEGGAAGRGAGYIWDLLRAVPSETEPVASAEGVGLTVYPNPTARRAVVPFELPEAAAVRIAVYDVLGRRVAVLAEGRYEAGRHRAVLDASGLGSGSYVVRAELVPDAGGVRAFTRKLTLVR